MWISQLRAEPKARIGDVRYRQLTCGWPLAVLIIQIHLWLYYSRT